MTNARAITNALKGEWRGSYGVCHCPCHDDRQSSLSVKDGDTQLLVKCHAGCESVSILHKLRDMGLLSGHEPSPVPHRANGQAKVEHIYPYYSSAGELLFEVARLNPKGFRQRCPDGKGGHLYKLDGVERVSVSASRTA